VSSSVREWLNLSVRWFHVFAGIMWVGQTYYFTWLDGQFRRLEAKSTGSAQPPEVWMVHSGGFYAVGKQQKLGISAGQVRWFRWEALMTWLGGMVLLVLVYYLGSGLLDPDVADISQAAGIAVGIGTLAVGWLIYDVATRSALARSQTAFAIVALLLTAATSWGLLHVFSGRAAYIHMGAMFGTIMTANVWLRILPAQRRMLAAAETGAAFDASLGEQAKLRSKHNTFMAVPVVFLMLSNHYPVATYGSRYAWPILVFLIVVGWTAARIIREA
jgi:uncharacterized membrane protein